MNIDKIQITSLHTQSDGIGKRFNITILNSLSPFVVSCISHDSSRSFSCVDRTGHAHSPAVQADFLAAQVGPLSAAVYARSSLSEVSSSGASSSSVNVGIAMYTLSFPVMAIVTIFHSL